MKDEIEFYINENGIACIPLKMYNDSLEEIERVNNELELQNIEMGREIERLNNIIKVAIEYLGIDEEILDSCEIYDVNGIEVYKILQGSDKE